MRRVLAGALLLCLVFAASAFADTMHIFYIPNDGSGDNFGFITYGRGYYITGFGGTAAYFFNFDGYPAGSTFGGYTTLFPGGGSARIGPVSDDVLFDLGTLGLYPITFPTNGKDFRAPVSISFDLTGQLVNSLQPISVGGGAFGYIQFSYFNGNYYPGDFMQVPEPSTLGLIGIGLLGVVGRVRKRRLTPRAR